MLPTDSEEFLHAELLVRDDPRFQVIPSLKISWELDVLNRRGGTKDSFASFDLEPHTTSFLKPTFVNGNHWMLCVARFPDAESREETGWCRGRRRRSERGHEGRRSA